MSLKHAFVSGKAAGNDASKVGGPHWDAPHVFDGGAVGSLLYRDTGASDGATWLSAPALDVRLYGAVGNGIADDTLAIQAAVDAAFAQGGGIVWFAPGTYVVNPLTQIVLKTGVTLAAARRSARLLVKANIGNWDRLFVNSGAVDNISFRGLWIDTNIANNAGSNIISGGASSLNAQIVLYITQGSHITIAGCDFDTTSSVNTIDINGSAVSDVRIEDCYFKFVMRSGNADYDNSTIYLNASNWIVAGNTFAGTPEANRGARCAIEVHGGPGTLRGNAVDGYQTVANVVASSTSVGDIAVDGNSGRNLNYGVIIWPATTIGVSNISVTGNTFNINQVAWAKVSTFGIGVLNDVNNTGLAQSIAITGNSVLFGDAGAGLGGTSAADTYGIGVCNVGGCVGFAISGNVITNAPSRGIFVGNNGSSVGYSAGRVTDNVVVNPGQNLSLATNLRTGIEMFSVLTDVVCEHNTVVDTWATTRAVQGIQVSAGTFTRVAVRGNRVGSAVTALSETYTTTVIRTYTPPVYFSAGQMPSASAQVGAIVFANHFASPQQLQFSDGGVFRPFIAKSLGVQTVGTVQLVVAHGLGYTPSEVRITMTGAGSIWRSQASDGTNVYLTADAAGRTAEVYVR